MKPFLRIAIALTLLAPAVAQAEGFVQSPAYQECTKLASTAPDQALAKADAWLKIDNSLSAYHCRAMALFGLQRFADAATALELVRDKIEPTDITLQTYVTHQTVKAWVNAEKIDSALQAIARQLETMGKTKHDNLTAAKLAVELLTERAELRSNYGQFTDAVKDLDKAVSLTPLNTNTLLARAAAFQQLGDTPLAVADAQSVLRLDPKNDKAKALLKQLGEKKVDNLGPPPSAALNTPLATSTDAQPVHHVPAENPPPTPPASATH